MATGNEKRLPVLQAIVSTSVKAKFASCGEKEANVLFISPGPIFRSPEGCLYLYCLACFFFFHHFFSYHFYVHQRLYCEIHLNMHALSFGCIPGPALWFSVSLQLRDKFFIALQYHIFSFNNSLAILFSFSD